jgi:hypothetical protein
MIVTVAGSALLNGNIESVLVHSNLRMLEQYLSREFFCACLRITWQNLEVAIADHVIGDSFSDQPGGVR